MRFGDFVLDKKQARLLRQGKELAIDPKVFELLVLFISQPNVTISRQYLLEHLWAGSIVTDNAVNKLIANLRKVLEDDPKNPDYIQTIPKRGYRFICEVALYEKHDSVKKTTTNNKRKYKFGLNKASTAIFAMLFLLICIIYWQTMRQSDETNTNHYTLELTRAHGAEESARMHPDKKHLYYLKKNSNNTTYQLWIKNIHTSKRQQIDIGKSRISHIISVDAEQNADKSNLYYLDKTPNNCSIYQAELTRKNQLDQNDQASLAFQWSQNNKLFDCNDKRIKDIAYHAKSKKVYFTAQPQNFWPNQIYTFDLTIKKQSIVTQNEPVGWGHHSIDISPDGSKLLIMSTNSDYKTQLLVLNLVNNEIIEGIKFKYPVREAIWYHDSEQVLYFAPSPANQIIKSDLNGNNATAIVNVSERLSPHMSLFPDGINLLFSTEQKNFSLRWLTAPKQANNIDNSTVYDVNPALFHNSQRYLFISKRSGRRQLYLGSYDKNQAETVTNFSKSLWLNYLAISADDQSILLNVENEVYNIPANILNGNKPLKALNKEHLVFTSEYPIISLDWFSAEYAAITTVKNGIPELKVLNVVDNTLLPLDGNWSYGMSDKQHPEYSYLIEQQSNALYRAGSLTLSADKAIDQPTLYNTQITLPKDFYHVKIDSNMVYYGNNEKNGDYLNTVPINNIGKSSKYLLNEFNGYDINNGIIMISDIESLEGDVHRTTQ